MGWLEKLQAAGAKATETAKETEPSIVVAPARPPAEIHQVTVSVRGASGNDPGEISLVYFTFEGGKLTLTNEKGSPLRGPVEVSPTQDPRSVARVEARKLWQGEGRFDRRLEYGPLGIG